MAVLTIDIGSPRIEVIDYLKEPFNLRLWTVHRDLYCIKDKCYEAISIDGQVQFAEIRCQIMPKHEGMHIVTFSWYRNGEITKRFGFQVIEDSPAEITLKVDIPDTIPKERRNTMITVINIELGILKQLLENSAYTINEADASILQSYHEKLLFT